MCWGTVVDDVFGTGGGGGKDNGALVEDDFNEVDWQGAGAIRWLVTTPGRSSPVPIIRTSKQTVLMTISQCKILNRQVC